MKHFVMTRTAIAGLIALAAPFSPALADGKVAASYLPADMMPKPGGMMDDKMGAMPPPAAPGAAAPAPQPGAPSPVCSPWRHAGSDDADDADDDADTEGAGAAGCDRGDDAARRPGEADGR